MISEKEFLEQYDPGKYPRPSVTADVAAFMVRSSESGDYKKDSEQRLTLLLVRRGGHPFKDCWALPGGFLQPGETVESCAVREIREETNVAPVSLMPVGVFSEPGRDPRGWIISNCYACVISEDSVRQAVSSGPYLAGRISAGGSAGRKNGVRNGILSHRRIRRARVRPRPHDRRRADRPAGKREKDRSDL